MGIEEFIAWSDGVVIRVEGVGFVVGGMDVVIELLLWSIGISVNVENGLGIDAVVNVVDSTGGVLGEGKPMTRQQNANIKRMMKTICNIFGRSFVTIKN